MSERSEAEGLLRIARQRMSADYPFHAHLLSESRFDAEPAVSTMAVTVRAGYVTILYAPSFVMECSFPELMGMLHHEINHVLFEHIFADPAKFPDRNARTIAEEVTVNEFIKEPLPGRPVTLDEFPRLPPGEDTETRYRRLTAAGRKPTQRGRKSGVGVPRNERSCTKKRPLRTKNQLRVVRPLDDHGVWVEARDEPSLGKLAMTVAVRQSKQQLSPSQWNSIPSELRRRIDHFDVGSSTGEMEEQLGTHTPGPAIDWKRLLRRYVGRVLEVRPVFNRPPRRFPQLVGILPGKGRRAGKPHVMTVIDTSASLGNAALGHISAELNRLALQNDVTVVECDAAIRAVFKYRGPISRIHGRGGTDFRPVFESQFLRAHHPDVLVYFTDGEGPAPSRKPPVPVIWCLTANGNKPATWGQSVHMTT